MNTALPIKGKKVTFKKSCLIHNYIEGTVSRYPHRTAITDQNTTISYELLNKKSNQLANALLLKKRIRPGSLIGVCFTPSVELIIAILGIIKAGSTYVPIDANYPKQYLDLVLNDASPSVILTNIHGCFSHNNLINISTLNLDCYSPDNLALTLSAESPAYVIYTSGSTGKPKGVIVPHRSINNHMLWMKKEFSFTKHDKILLKTPLSFDPSVWEIFLPLFIGAELVIAPSGSHIDSSSLLNTILKHQVTTIQFVPTILHKFLNHKKVHHCQSLKMVFVGGESLPSSTKKLFFKKLTCQLINLYGPTETTIQITSHIVKNSQEEFEKNCIGKPIYNTDLYIFDSNMQLSNVGEPGELYISGECLANGYLNNPGATKKSFVKNPFFKDKKMYKTGDIVRCLSDGAIEYIGRGDHQLKINGIRVEMEALTEKIRRYSNIKNCVVLKKQDEEFYSYLACYIVPKSSKHIDIDILKNYLGNFFLKPIIPREFFVLDEFPILPNGKIDTNTLRDSVYHHSVFEIPHTKNKIQTDLLNICSRLLNTKKLSVCDDLYSSGMDSLFCLLLMARIEKKYHVDLSIYELLANKNVDNLSMLITDKLTHSKSNNDTNHTVINLKDNGYKTPLFLIHPIGGTVFWYNYIAKHFDPDRPLYGIQDPGIESGEYLFNSLEEMANFYFKHIKSIQPNGPYIIGGASFGATVAVEICRNLIKEDVIAIPVLDGWSIYPDDLKDENYFRESMKKQQDDWKKKFGSYGHNKEYVNMFNTQKHRLELLYKYKMRKIDHQVVLFKSKEIIDIFLSIDRYDNNWNAYTNVPPKIISVNGNHETMFQEPNVKDLAVRLSESLISYEI